MRFTRRIDRLAALPSCPRRGDGALGALALEAACASASASAACMATAAVSTRSNRRIFLSAGRKRLGQRLEPKRRVHDALVLATREVGFPVGHASAQMAWRGIRSRPVWRILVYSNESPPGQRGLVVVDGVDGTVVASHIEDNPEKWDSA